MTLEELKKLCDAATPGPWFVNGLDIESSHVIVAEGEEWVQLYDTETGKPTRRVKLHQEGDDDDDDDALVILSTSSILGDRPFEEALATAEFIAAAREMLPKLIRVAEKAKAFDDYYLAANFVGHGITAAFEPTAKALAALETK